jgi:AsmA-like C-terminal region
VRGGFSPQGYVLQCDGAAELGRLAGLMRLLGFARWEVLHEVKGKAVVHVALRDAWMRDAVTLPLSEGTVTLTDVNAQTAWLPGIVSVKNAELLMARGEMRWQNVEAAWANTKLDGSADKIKTCEEGECGWRVAAHTAELDLAAMRRAYSESEPQKLLELFRGNAAVGWPEIHMDLTADAVKAGLLTLRKFDTAVVINGGAVKIVRLDGQLLGGTLQGTGGIQMGTGTTVLSLGLSGINVEDAGSIFHERWGSGTAESSLGLTLHGLAAQGANGEFTAMIRNGAMAAPAAEGTPLGRFDSWQMAGTINNGRVLIERSVLAKDGATSTATGSVSFDRTMDWAVTRWQDNSEAAAKAEKLIVRGELGQTLSDRAAK